MKSKLAVIGGRIDLNLLVVFDAIYRSRNLTSAGHTVGLSQPAMMSRARQAARHL
jgi:DNA-binding transcriptional LysR family regulator